MTEPRYCPECREDGILVELVQEFAEDGGGFEYTMQTTILTDNPEGLPLAPDDDHGTCTLFTCPECGESLTIATSAITGEVSIF